MSENRQRFTNNDDWTFLQFPKLRMNGNPWNPDSPKQAPVLFPYISKGNPCFRLYLNENGGTGTRDGSIRIAFNPLIFSSLLALIKRIADNGGETCKYTCKTLGHFIGGQYSADPKVDALVTVGRNPKGIVYISVTPRGRTPAVFDYKSDPYALFYGGDGELMDAAFASEIAALGWVKIYQDLMPAIMATIKEDPTPKKKENGDGGGYQSRSNNGGWNGGNQSKGEVQNWDDDVTF